MALINSSPSHQNEAITIVDEISSTEYYIGISVNSDNGSKPYWRIKKIYKVSTVWKTAYPNGDQSYQYIWDDRLSYTYL